MPETHLEFSVPLRTCPDSQSHVLILPSAAQQLRLVRSCASFCPCANHTLHDQPLALLVSQIKFRHRSGFGPFSFGASTVPRYCPRFLMIETRQLRSLAAVGFFLALFIGCGRGTPGGHADKIMAANAESESLCGSGGRLSQTKPRVADPPLQTATSRPTGKWHRPQ